MERHPRETAVATAQKYALVVLATSVGGAALLGTVAVILASPSTALPVGLSVAVGDSMGEAAPQVVLYGPAPDGLQAGQTAVFHTSEGWLRHELVQRTSEGWLTQGTAEPHLDQWSGGPGEGVAPVKRSQVAGVVYAAVPVTAVAAALAGLLALLSAGTLYHTRTRWVGPTRARADALLSVSRGVTSRLSEADLSTARSMLLVAMLVLAAVGGAVTFGPIPAVDVAVADSQVHDDFEDGDVSEYLENNGFLTVTSDPAKVFEGSYAGHVGTSTNDQTRIEVPAESYDSSKFYLQPDSLGGTDGSYVIFKNEGTYDNAAKIMVQPNGSLFVGGDPDQNTGITLSEGTYYRFDIDWDWAADNFELSVTDTETGNTLYTGTHVAYPTGCCGIDMTGYDKIQLKSNDVTYNIDFIAADGASAGVAVDGTVTGSSGSALGDATVELRQSGTLIESTTTASDGSYTFSTVSDGTYTVRATGSGYQNKSKSITVAGSPRTVDLTLYESGTFEREFQLGEQASKTYPPSLAELQLYRFDRAIEFPLPGGTTFKAGPGDWTEVTTTEFNAYGTASARLENGEPYRVDVVATSGDRATRWESLGWRANKSASDPFLITVGSSSDTSTATATTTGTATSPTATPVETAGGGGSKRPGLNPPCDPFDQDDDGDLQSCPDGDGTDGPGPTVTYTENDGFGPRVAGECLLADGTSGVLVEYWDPSYETTSLTFNVSHANSSYAGERTFDTPAGYATWCVADAVTGNASDATEGALSGNYTANGTTFNYTDDLQQSALFGGPVGGGGGAGETTPGQRVVGIGLTAGIGYLLVRRFTEFRLSNAVAGALSRARSLVGGRS